MAKIVFVLASILLLLYIGLSPRVATFLYSSMLFHPFKYPEGEYDVGSIGGIPVKDIYFKSTDGTKLHGWYFENPQATNTILFSHGNAGNVSTRKHFIELLLKTGASVFIYDYRGYGHSEGSPSLSGICDDACAAYDYLVQECHLSPRSIILYGESLGTAVTCQLAVRKPEIGGVILQSGFSSLRAIGMHTVPLVGIYPNFLYPQPDMDSASLLSSIHVPILILHGTEDKVVPFDHSQVLYAHALEPKKLVALRGAGHKDLWQITPDAYYEAVKSFIAEVTSVQLPKH